MASTDLHVVSAKYGVEGKWVDCLNFVRAMVKDDRLVLVNDGREVVELGDPAPGETKYFVLTYRLDGAEKTESFPKHVKISIGRPIKDRLHWWLVDGSLYGHTIESIAKTVSDHFAARRGSAIAILEIGTQYGRSAIGFCELLLQSGFTPNLVTLDIYAPSRDYPASYAREAVTRDNIARSFVSEHITAMRIDALDDYRAALPRERFDFIYIDGDHTFKHVVADCAIAKSLIAVNGIIMGDDYSVGAVRSAVSLVFGGAAVDAGNDQWIVAGNAR